MLFEACRDGAEMLEFVEEALDDIALAIEPFVERWQVDPVGHEFDVGVARYGAPR